MDDSIFDSFTRRAAAGLQRRSLLAALGGAIMLTAVDPLAIQAGNKGKKDKNKKKGKKKKPANCDQQELDCLGGSRVYCRNNYGPGSTMPDSSKETQCLQERMYCCTLYGACKEFDGNQCIANMTL
jgi:hypothetical protein